MLYATAVERLSSVGRKLRERQVRLREFGDYTVLQRWLLAVRGVDITHTPLRMAEPALAK